MKRRGSLRLAFNQIRNKKKGNEEKQTCLCDFKLCVLSYRANKQQPQQQQQQPSNKDTH